MASLYKRASSPFWWVKWRDGGKIVRQSTKCRVGVGADLISARKLRAELSVREQSSTTATAQPGGWDWVPQFLASRTAGLGNQRRMRSIWSSLSAYLEKSKTSHPHQLTREWCLCFHAWRISGDDRKPAHQNTAILELRIMSVVMREAVLRGFCGANPCIGIGIKRLTPAPRPELSAEDVLRIRSGIGAELASGENQERCHFLRVSFEIAMAQGCRLSETRLNVWSDADLDRLEITFHAKGDRYYSTELNPALVPLFLELRAAGRKKSYDYGDGIPGMCSGAWTRFMKRHGLKFSFHSTRVTVISRMERAGAPEAVVMRVVGHASTTVHRVYRRFRKDELQSWWPSLGDAATPRLSENQGAPSSSEARS